jgi:hypothetical protein
MRLAGIGTRSCGARIRIPAALVTAAATVLVATACGVGRASAEAARSASPLRAGYGRLPLTFAPNVGQTDARVRYSAQGPGYAVYFTAEEVVLVLAQSPASRSAHDAASSPGLRHATSRREPGPTRAVALALRFIGADARVGPEGARRSRGTVNYLTGGDPARWRTGVPTYGEVRYRDVWPGIDLVFRGGRGELKYELLVRPGARVEAIRLAYRGAERLRLDEAGNLLVDTALGVFADERPISYQEVGRARVPVASRFVVAPQATDGPSFGFEVGSEYDPRYPLTIDPSLTYATFLGGSGFEEARAIAVNGAGNAYVTGSTSSFDFPTTVGAFDRSNDDQDVFVAKLNATGTRLVYATFLGGTSFEDGRAIAVDRAGNAYVTGGTGSVDFPTTPGAFARSPRSAEFGEAFVAKLNPTGTRLVYATYLGGSRSESASGIAVDPLGNAYVTGATDSPDFPTTRGVLDRSFNGGNDAFVVALNGAGSGLVYGTFLGGFGDEGGAAIAVNASGLAFVTGSTSSPDFPTSAGAFDRSRNAFEDVFVAKLSRSGANLRYGTFLGGSGSQSASAIAIDAQGNAYVTGATGSADFPTTRGAFDRSLDGSQDAFVTKLNNAGTGLVFSTYLGGGGDEQGRGIALDASGRAHVAGETSSRDFPAVDGVDRSFNGPLFGMDAFVARLGASGNRLQHGSYLGGFGYDFAFGIAVDAAGNTYVAGATESPNFPLTRGAFDRTLLDSDVDAFVAKFRLESPTSSAVSMR